MGTSDFSLGSGPSSRRTPCGTFQTRELSNDRMKFKRMFEAEARKFDHVSQLKRNNHPDCPGADRAGFYRVSGPARTARALPPPGRMAGGGARSHPQRWVTASRLIFWLW